MFLLILNIGIRLHSTNCFTFQYVSINIPVLSAGGSGAQTFTFQYVSINILMKCYLKKKQNLHWKVLKKKQNLFTFQYVSINIKTTRRGQNFSLLFTFQYVSINMFWGLCTL